MPEPIDPPNPTLPSPIVEKAIGEGLPPLTDIGYGHDAARYIMQPKRFRHPFIWNPHNDADYVWPLGIEAFTVRGEAGLAVHKYIDDNAPVVEVTHRDERRIELSGILPGSLAAKNMKLLIDALVAKHDEDRGKVLGLPHMFPRTQIVAVESYEFSREEGDRTGSIAYTVNFLRLGEGALLRNPPTTNPPPNPKSNRGKKKGGARYFFVNAKHRTLKSIAKKVYNNPDKWKRLLNLNKQALQSGAAWGTAGPPPSTHKWPTRPLPLGFGVRY